MSASGGRISYGCSVRVGPANVSPRTAPPKALHFSENDIGENDDDLCKSSKLTHFLAQFHICWFVRSFQLVEKLP